MASGDSFSAKLIIVSASSNQRSRKKYPGSREKKSRITGKNAKKLLFSGGKEKDRWKKLSAGLPCFIKNYRVIASQGQLPTQAPHSMQSASLITALPSFREIALTGQLSTQAPQPAQVSSLIFAAISNISLGCLLATTR